MSGLFYAMIDVGESMFDLARDQAEWSQATFGSDANRGPVGALKHLEREAREAIAAVGGHDPLAVREELADCFLLILDASRRSGLKPLDLIRAAQAKMVKNRSRAWPTPTIDEPVEHIRSDDLTGRATGHRGAQ